MNRLRTLFNAWWDSRDRVCEGKSRFIMQTELYKRIQFRRGLTALRLHADEKYHQKQIIGVF